MLERETREKPPYFVAYSYTHSSVSVRWFVITGFLFVDSDSVYKYIFTHVYYYYVLPIEIC